MAHFALRYEINHYYGVCLLQHLQRRDPEYNFVFNPYHVICDGSSLVEIVMLVTMTDSIHMPHRALCMRKPISLFPYTQALPYKIFFGRNPLTSLQSTCAPSKLGLAQGLLINILRP
jgi:hypothetical protein